MCEIPSSNRNSFSTGMFTANIDTKPKHQTREIFKTDLSCCKNVKDWLNISWIQIGQTGSALSSYWLMNDEITRHRSRDQRCQGFAVLKLSVFHYKWDACVTSGNMKTAPRCISEQNRWVDTFLTNICHYPSNWSLESTWVNDVIATAHSTCYVRVRADFPPTRWWCRKRTDLRLSSTH